MKELLKVLKNSKRVGIIAHISPDPDCMGSMSALSCILKSMDKEVYQYIDIGKLTECHPMFNLAQDISTEIDIENIDTLIAVDIATEKLMGKYAPVFNRYKNNVVIDHHASRDLMAQTIYVDDTKSSCSEIIYEIAKCLKTTITPEIASYLLAGIIGDTDCFCNDNTNKNTHLVAGELYEAGANAIEIIFELHKKQTMSGIALRKILYDNMVVDQKIAYMIYTKKHYKQANSEDCSCFVNELLNLEDNIFAFVIKQKDKNYYTVSLRCKEGYDVSIIAQKYQGGGHVQASGMSFTGSPIKYAKQIYEECLNQLKEKRNYN